MISRLKLIVVGKQKNKELKNLVKDYDKKISRYIPFEVVELKDSDKEKEGERILKALENQRGILIAFTEEGKPLTSRQFAGKFQEWEGTPTLIIGGPDGLSEAVKQRVDFSLSLSRMTFTHEMAQMIVHEQIFRVFSILNKTGYHRD